MKAIVHKILLGLSNRDGEIMIVQDVPNDQVDFQKGERSAE